MPTGVITVSDIDYGIIFGPFPVPNLNMDATFVIGILTKDKIRQQGQLQVDPPKTRALEWLTYIQPARNEEEQNMEAYLKNGRVFYRTLRIVKASEELLVWYSKDLCQQINIPEIKRLSNVDKEQYVCSFCGDIFEHVYPLRAHVRFKCEVSSYHQTIAQGTDVTNSQVNRDTMLHYSVPERKRRHEDEESMKISPKIIISDAQEKKSSQDSSLEIDINSNTCYEAKDCNLSAFRRVEKFCASNLISKQTSPNQMSSPNNAYPTNSSKFSPRHTSNEQFVSPLLTTGLGMASLDPKFLIRDSFVAPRFSHPFVNMAESSISSSDNFVLDPAKQLAYADRFNAGVPFMKSSNPMVGKLLHHSSPSTLNTPLQAISLGQNWCAKCNASFRMTSDLVYHMRSHHKREFDPVKKKRDDKLKCNICHESFRERHHLTRHMTSHA